MFQYHVLAQFQINLVFHMFKNMQTKVIVIANINEQRISLAKMIKNIAYT